MKKIPYSFLIISWFYFFSCKPHFDVTPACDNTTNNCAISLDFTSTFYYCNFGAYSNFPPPTATANNYLNKASATNDIVNVTDQNAYLCQINVKNDEPGQIACTSPGVLKLYWTVPGVNQTVKNFSHYDADITVDYYDPVDPCGDGRPYFVGKAGLPAGATSWTPIPMFTQTSYKP
jgi:hypothetical protein